MNLSVIIELLKHFQVNKMKYKNIEILLGKKDKITEKMKLLRYLLAFLKILWRKLLRYLQFGMEVI